jgi:hypothetical protein
VGEASRPEVVWNVLCRLSSQIERAGGCRRRLRIRDPYLYLRSNSPLPETRIKIARATDEQLRQWQTWTQPSSAPCKAVSSKVSAQSRATARSARARESQSNTARSNVWDPDKAMLKCANGLEQLPGVIRTIQQLTGMSSHGRDGERAAQ